MTSTFTSLFKPRLNLVSSLGYTGTWGDGVRFSSWPSVASPASNTGILFSSISLNFSGISSAFTSEKIKDLNNTHDKKQSELEYYKSKTDKQLWKIDLENLNKMI